MSDRPDPAPPTPAAPDNARPHAATAISGHLDTRTAAMEVAESLYDAIAGDCHLLLAFGSFHHRAAFAEAMEHLRRTLTPGAMLAVTAESVLGGNEERLGVAGLSALALRLPGADVVPWSITPDTPLPSDDPEAVRARIGADDDARAALLLADPFTAPVPAMLPALDGCRGPGRPLPLYGALASGASQPGHNLLALDGDILPAGAVGVTLRGPVRIDGLVSQGARPVGEPQVVTKAKNNVIAELGGRPAMAALKAMTVEMPERERGLINRGLMVGVLVNEFKERYGRGDFLVRNVVALDLKKGTIAIGDRIRPGQKIQFHVRDRATAAEDLDLLLDLQQLDEPPLAAVLFTCNSRGTRLFEDPNHDLGALHRRLGEIPVAGLFAAGEIGPLGDRSYLHGHTACAVIIRA